MAFAAGCRAINPGGSSFTSRSLSDTLDATLGRAFRTTFFRGTALTLALFEGFIAAAALGLNVGSGMGFAVGFGARVGFGSVTPFLRPSMMICPSLV